MKDMEVIAGLKIDMREYKKFISETPDYKRWLINEERKDRITERTKQEMENMRRRANNLLDKSVILTIEFEEYKGKVADVSGIITFVGNTCLILDSDSNLRTHKDRQVWHFRDIVAIKPDNVRELKSAGTVSFVSDPLPQTLEINKKLIKAKKLTPKQKEDQRIRSLRCSEIWDY